jgi:hypothetical protein
MRQQKTRTRGALSLHRGDPLFRLLLDHFGLDERGIAALTVIVGFGVLGVWYLGTLFFDPASSGLRGLFEYYSATLGDLILLPLLNALAARYALVMAPGIEAAVRVGSRSEGQALRRLALIGRIYDARKGLIFVVAIVAAVVAWQRVDELYGIDRNWTVPIWGEPRLVAWYHQAFFGFEAYLTTYLFYRYTTTWRLLRHLEADPTTRPTAIALAGRSLRLFSWVLLGWGGFVSLRLMDFFHVTPTVSLQALFRLPAPVATAVFYYVILAGAGLWPLVALSRKAGRFFDRRPAVLLAAAAVAAPLAGPAARVLFARIWGS